MVTRPLSEVLDSSQEHRLTPDTGEPAPRPAPGTSRLRKLLAESLEQEAEDVVAAGSIGYMSRILVQTTLPHLDIKAPLFTRSNGIITLTIVGSEGIPFGGMPRLLIAWLCTEAVRTKSPRLALGRSRNEFMGKLGLPQDGASATRMSKQALRLFTSLVTVKQERPVQGSLDVRNLLIADSAQALWNPKRPDERSLWETQLTLSNGFFSDVVAHPVPINLDVLRTLRQSPMAMDIYCWLGYRVFLLRAAGRPSVTIPWEALKLQFGSGFEDSAEGLKGFRRSFSKRLKEALLFYREAKVDVSPQALRVFSSPLAVPYTGKARLSRVS